MSAERELFPADEQEEDRLNVAMIWYPVLTLGYGNRLGVWTQGCPKKCPGCISPEFQSFHGGKSCTQKDILDYIPAGERPDGLTISGGEPFAQPKALLNLIRAYRSAYPGDILVFSGYSLDELTAMDHPDINLILEMIDVLVDGPYDPELNDGSGLRGSSNQRIHVFRYSDRYHDAEKRDRKLQCIFWDDKMCFVGIPPA